LTVEADARFNQARKSSDNEPPAAYRADALVALVAGEPIAVAKSSSRTSSPRATAVIRVDAKALKRGHARHGEVCEIPGVGPVPVAAVHRQLSDAHVRIVVVDGHDVTTVCHVGRSIPRHLQSALEERDPVCVVPDCEVGAGLENHHWDVPYAECKTSTLAGVARLCSWHHGFATYEGWVLRGGPGAWQWREPHGGCSFETGPPVRDTG